MHHIPRLLAALTLCLAVAACSRPAPPVQEVEQRKPSAGSLVQAMDPDQKRSEIDSGFPLEVPVPEGEVVRANAQGPDAWDYEILVPAVPAEVSEFYRSSYVARSWLVTEERPLEGGGAELTLEKGGAQSRVSITPEAEGSRAVVILGVGAPVLETQ
ncbi:MAG TPA: hypothetical protein VLA05_07015 [Coriobacteriia bacterium]|nr:hypothetical protein [Coriobacteriia bacterium]